MALVGSYSLWMRLENKKRDLKADNEQDTEEGDNGITPNITGFADPRFRFKP